MSSNGLPDLDELIEEVQPKTKPLPTALHTYAEVIGGLRKRLHDKYISKLPRAGKQFSYVEWHTIVRLLDAAAPGWFISDSKLTITEIGRYIVELEISVPTSDMDIIRRRNFGTDMEMRSDFNPFTRETLPLGWHWKRDRGVLLKDKDGNFIIEQDKEQGTDPVTNAFAQAFKRTAAMFEAGLHLYYEDAAREQKASLAMADENKKLFPANYAIAVARRMLEMLGPACERTEVVGSLRRRRDWVHDVDILIIPRPLDVEDLFNQPNGVNTMLDIAVRQLIAEHENVSFHLKKDGKPTNGADMKVLEIAHPKDALHGLTVDLYTANDETWATLLLIKTGSREHNIMLTTTAKRKGWMLKADGTGLVDANGQRIAWQSEEDIFAALSLPYIEPSQREVEVTTYRR